MFVHSFLDYCHPIKLLESDSDKLLVDLFVVSFYALHELSAP